MIYNVPIWHMSILSWYQLILNFEQINKLIRNTTLIYLNVFLIFDQFQIFLSSLSKLFTKNNTSTCLHAFIILQKQSLIFNLVITDQNLSPGYISTYLILNLEINEAVSLSLSLQGQSFTFLLHLLAVIQI